LNTEQPGLARTLGSRDFSIFLIAALVNLDSVPVVAGIGPAALACWVFGSLHFFVPQAIAVPELSTRFPQEGGIYR
jgi:amino acid transporter